MRHSQLLKGRASEKQNLYENFTKRLDTAIETIESNEALSELEKDINEKLIVFDGLLAPHSFACLIQRSLIFVQSEEFFIGRCSTIQSLRVVRTSVPMKRPSICASFLRGCYVSSDYIDSSGIMFGLKYLVESSYPASETPCQCDNDTEFRVLIQQIKVAVCEWLRRLGVNEATFRRWPASFEVHDPFG